MTPPPEEHFPEAGKGLLAMLVKRVETESYRNPGRLPGHLLTDWLWLEEPMAIRNQFRSPAQVPRLGSGTKKPLTC